MKTILEVFKELGIEEYHSAMRDVMIHDVYMLTGLPTKQKTETVCAVELTLKCYESNAITTIVKIFRMGLIAAKLQF